MISEEWTFAFGLTNRSSCHENKRQNPCWYFRLKWHFDL